MLGLSVLGVGLALWVSVGYGYAFAKTSIRWFLLHSLRWLMFGQYIGLLAYLLIIKVLPINYPELGLLGVIGLIGLRKIVPMLGNRYTEGNVKARDILLLRVATPTNQQLGLVVPFNHRIDLGTNRRVLFNLIVYGLLVGLNWVIIYGAMGLKP